jgi:2-polyprenyl-6-hydroxyphenyl methylase/3-demethylubiquinone-9 3-methyltransferase
MEMLEHVPDPSSVVRACATLCKPGGWVFFSTIHRNPKSFLFAIVGAEYVLNLLPRGTHEYLKFIRPAELAGFCREAGLQWAARAAWRTTR